MKHLNLAAVAALLMILSSCGKEEIIWSNCYPSHHEELIAFADGIDEGASTWFSNNLPVSRTTTFTQVQFLAEIAQPSVMQEINSGIPIEITMAQAILESRWGKSKLTKEANNYFGIKEKRPGYKGTDELTKEFVDNRYVTETASFRVYALPIDSFNDRSEWFYTNPYRDYTCVKGKGKEAWLDKLIENGYATDPHYRVKINSIISQYKIDKFAFWMRGAFEDRYL